MLKFCNKKLDIFGITLIKMTMKRSHKQHDVFKIARIIKKPTNLA